MSDSSKSSGELAYDALVAQIRLGNFKAGDRLREEEVSAQLSLSRTPVREALRRLESDGIVEHRPRVGAVIRALGHTEVIELYEMRMVLERTAAEMAATHGASAEFDALDTLNDRIEQNRGMSDIAAAINQDFHRGLYLAARNRFLMQAAHTINNALLLLGPTTYVDPSRVDIVVAEHRAITQALRSRKPDVAGAAAEAHLRTSLLYRLQGGHS